MDKNEATQKPHKNKSALHKHKRLILTLFVIFVISLSAAGLYFSGFIGGVIKIFEPVSIESVNKKIQEGDKKTANDLAKKLVEKSDTIESRRVLVLTEQLNEDYEAVIKTYKPILDNKMLNYQDYQNIAVAYYYIHNNTEAAKYYRLAADSWPIDDPARNPEIEYLYRHADFLEGKIKDV
jgi:tetratricopeptide (TPR) repeat protein